MGMDPGSQVHFTRHSALVGHHVLLVVAHFGSAPRGVIGRSVVAVVPPVGSVVVVGSVSLFPPGWRGGGEDDRAGGGVGGPWSLVTPHPRRGDRVDGEKRLFLRF